MTVTKRHKTKNSSNDKKHTGNTAPNRWIYLWLALVIIAAIGVIVFLPHKKVKAGPPKISFSETLWNFGRTPQNSRVSHTFWIKNIGGDTLRIIKVEPG
jgi:hypothetical protein